MKQNLKVYVGCALTHAPEEYRKGISLFKEKLRAKGFEVLDFLWAKLKDPRDVTPKEVYEWDILGCVKECDLFVAFADIPSTGLGYELGTVIEKYGKPVLVLAHKDSVVTRLVEGVTHPKCTHRYYKNFEDAILFVEEKAEDIS
jgi:hypothetical protein